MELISLACRSKFKLNLFFINEYAFKMNIYIKNYIIFFYPVKNIFITYVLSYENYFFPFSSCNSNNDASLKRCCLYFIKSNVILPLNNCCSYSTNCSIKP